MNKSGNTDISVSAVHRGTGRFVWDVFCVRSMELLHACAHDARANPIYCNHIAAYILQTRMIIHMITNKRENKKDCYGHTHAQILFVRVTKASLAL